MRDQSNAGQRVINARQVTRGNADSLENTHGSRLPDGAQCWVVSEEANYRFLKDSVLHPDGVFVVQPFDGEGRWVREASLCGFALLSQGVQGRYEDQNLDQLTFVSFAQAQLAQFSLSNVEGRLVYTGRVPRLAAISARAEMTGDAELIVTIDRDKSSFVVARGRTPRTLEILCPGDSIKLSASVASGARDGAMEVLCT